MENNMYEPPKSDLSVADDKPGSMVKAVVIGTLIEIVGTFLVGISIGIVFAVLLSKQGRSPEEMASALEHIDPWSGLGLAAMALGSLVSVLAGYVCARIANRVSYKAAYILAGISFTLGTITGYGSYSWGALLLLGMLSIGCVLAGAWLHIRTLRT